MRMKKAIPALPVRDINESIEFYSSKLGFDARHQEEGFAVLVRDEVELHLWKSGDEGWRMRGASMAIMPICSGAESFLAGTASCRIEVVGIDELYMEYKAQGIVYDAATVVVEQPWGDREFPALDHHRNLLTFYEVMP
jgi:catechol 2,3-dioxygenase-like lactoylglutathione lyase family enzyme